MTEEIVSYCLLLAGLILFILAAIGVPSGRLNWVAAGLACWEASQLIRQ